MNCLIVDDEPLAREGLDSYAAQIDFLQVAGLAEDATQALSILEQQSIDLLFLDINMPKISGIDFLKSLKTPPIVIVTTAYPSFALEGFQLEVLDYLVKPITFPRFLKAAVRAKKQYDLLQSRSAPESTEDEPHFFIKCEGKIEKIEWAELHYVEAMQNYVHLHTDRGRFTALAPLKQVENKLPTDQFLRVHKSFLVNRAKVRTIEGNTLLLQKRAIPVSRSRLAAVTEAILGDRLIN